MAVGTIARRLPVSHRCLELLFARLRKAGLVRSTPGRNGGYTFGRRPEAHSVADIVAVAEADASGAGKRKGRASAAIWRPGPADAHGLSGVSARTGSAPQGRQAPVSRPLPSTGEPGMVPAIETTRANLAKGHQHDRRQLEPC